MDGVNQDNHSRAQNASAWPSYMIAGIIEGPPERLLMEWETGPTLQTQTGLGGRGPYSAEQWEVHKPVIKQLYIDEKKTYKRVTELLRDVHQFYPTMLIETLRRRQFYRKISEWGFEKNIKDKDMRVLVQGLNKRVNDGEDIRIELRGQKVDPVKIQRWRRRKLGTQDVERQFSVDLPRTSLSSMEIQNAKQDEPSMEPSENSASEESAGGIEPSQETGNSIRENFNRWSLVNVPGSPMLTHLFRELEIECDSLIPSLDLSSSDPAVTPSSTLETESDEEMINDNNSREWSESSTEVGSKDLIRCSREVLPGSEMISNGSIPAIAELSFSELRLRERDFSKGQPLKMNISYIFGLSPFPKTFQTGRERAAGHKYVSAHARLQSWQDQEFKCKHKLRHFERRHGAGHPKVLDVMGKLAHTYFEQGKYEEAEQLYWQRATSYETTSGMKHIQTLSAYLKVVDTLRIRGKVLEAYKIHEGVHENIRSIFEPNDKIHLQSSSIRTSMLYRFNECDAAEELIRKTFQIQLHTSGLWSEDTLEYMMVLAKTLKLCGKYAESEHLLRINIHLCREVLGPFSKAFFDCKQRLAILLMEKGGYEESKCLAMSIAEQTEALVGQQHVDTLYYYYLAAMCTKMQGDLVESERQLRTVLERQIRSGGKQQQDAYLSMDGLSGILTDMGRHTEATILLEKCQKGWTDIYGNSYWKTLSICCRLADNYKKVGRSEDAVALLQQNVNNAQKDGEKPTEQLLETIAKLAELLREKDRYREAATSYEEVLHGYAEIYGLSNERTLHIVDCLGFCYERLRLYREAVALYQRTFDQLRSINDDGSPAPEHFSQWMTGIQETLAASIEDDNEEEDDEGPGGLTYREGLNKKEEPLTNAKDVSVLDSAMEENVSSAEEDWMTKLFDFDLLEQSPPNVIELAEGDCMDET